MCGKPSGGPREHQHGCRRMVGCLAGLWSTETWHAETLSQPSLAGGQGGSPASSQRCSVPSGASQVKQETK